MRTALALLTLLLAGCPQTRADLVGVDADGDGYGNWVDCNDHDPNVNPGATEIPYNGVDDDCNPATPDDDLDGDGYKLADDCDDTDPNVHPGATEQCNGIDDDCNGMVDDGLMSTWYADADGDGFGDPNTTSQRCDAGTGWVHNDADCDDTNANVHPGATEVCNGIDDNCDGNIDTDTLIRPTWYRDADGDGYGDPTDTQIACDQPDGYIATAGDCNDDPVTGADIHPGTTETCDGLDDDCNGLVDDGAAPLSDWWLDADGDGYGAGNPIQACSAPSADYVSNNDDCDDTNASFHPGAAKQCGGVDADCDTHIDFDADGDGFVSRTDCDSGLDCDDGDDTVYPGQGCGWGRSCLEAMQNNPSFVGTDQNVLLDPQWDGNTATFWCDFTDDTADGAGWTRLYTSDFQTSGDENGWYFYNSETGQEDDSKAVLTTCASAQLLGGYDETAGGYLWRPFDAQHIPHQEILVGVTYYRLDSWDGEYGFIALIPAPGGTPGTGYALWYEDLRASTNMCGNPTWNDAIFPVVRHAWDDSDQFDVEFGSNLNQLPTDESFGIDDVSVWVR